MNVVGRGQVFGPASSVVVWQFCLKHRGVAFSNASVCARSRRAAVALTVGRVFAAAGRGAGHADDAARLRAPLRAGPLSALWRGLRLQVRGHQEPPFLKRAGPSIEDFNAWEPFSGSVNCYMGVWALDDKMTDLLVATATV